MTENPNWKHPPELSEQDAELLSAYIDDMLERAERQQLERRLADEPFLRTELDALRQTVAWIQTLPELQAPRNFTLPADMAAPAKPKIVAMPRRKPASIWMGAAAAAAVFVLLVGVMAVLRPALQGGLAPVSNEVAGAMQSSTMIAAAPTQIPQMTLAALPTPAPSEAVMMQFSAPASEEQEMQAEGDDMVEESAAFMLADVGEATDSIGADGGAASSRMLDEPAESAENAADATTMTGMVAPQAAPAAKSTLEEMLVTLLRLVLRVFVIGLHNAAGG